MTNPATGLCGAAVVLMNILSLPLFSQQTRAFNQNASRSNHTQRVAGDERGFVLRLNGDRASAHGDSIAASASFMPSVGAHYYNGRWGVGAEFGTFTSAPHFNPESYSQNIRSFAQTSISSSQWKTSYLMAGPSYRQNIGMLPLTIGGDLLAGMMKMKAPSFSITDRTDGTVIADYYRDSKQSTAIENPLFAIKPTARIEWFPAGGFIGLNAHVAYMHAFGGGELSTYYRDLSQVKFDGAAQQEVRNQVLSAPMIETKTTGPVRSFAFGAGLSVNLGSSAIKSPRDAASGLATGKRQHSRDAASGLATGRRQHSRDAASGLATGKRQHSRDAASGLATGRRQHQPAFSDNDNGTGLGSEADSRLHRDAASGLATGKRQHAYEGAGNSISRRVLPTVNKRETGLSEQESDNSAQSCGPVTQRLIREDGTIEEMIFSCPADAAVFRNSLPKQTQQKSFGEKILADTNGDAIIHRGIASRNLISGKVLWATPADMNGIVTNKSVNQREKPGSVNSEKGSTRRSSAPLLGTRVTIAARDAASGLATGKRQHRDAASGLATGKRQHRDAASGLATGKRQHRDAASGLATGKRQHQPVFADDDDNDTSLHESVSVKSNPYFSGKGIAGDNPLYLGMGNIRVSLVSATTGQTIASTTTENQGDFFFANVPDGDYEIELEGAVTIVKEYDMQVETDADILGVVEQSDEQIQLSVTTQRIIDNAQASISSGPAKNAAKTDHWGDPHENLNGKHWGDPHENLNGKHWGDPHENVNRKVKPLSTRSDSGGFIADDVVQPGAPLAGVEVRAGKKTNDTQRLGITDDEGYFEMEGLDQGNYRFVVQRTLLISDSIPVTAGAASFPTSAK